MPAPLRTTYHKAEAKYNVTTEFPSLGLHSAAATGNIGLVEYALDHGQPINSVLDGVLPLHAACAGGNVQVVRLLIDHGADVNAPRLPRRYSNDKNRDASAPIVGTSGSTPLHFAAANGNTGVVSLLLLHGAHANRSDKHGVTPEALARQHGWLECADVLQEWVVNKDRDLRERPNALVDDLTGFTSRERLGSFGAEGEPSTPPSTRRRLHMKHSIDNALFRFITPSADTKTQLPAPASNVPSTPPASPSRASGEYTLDPSSDEGRAILNEGKLRRPSLPQLLQPSTLGPHSRKTSTPSINPNSRRPRSAGTGAENNEREQEAPDAILGRSSGGKRLGSKYSLMNIFKKAQSGEPVDLSVPSSTPPNPDSTTALPLSASPNRPSPLSNPSASSTNLNDNPSTSSISISPFSRTGFRFHRGSDASSTRGSISQVPSTPQPIDRNPSTTIGSPPRAVELHNAMAQRQQEKQQRQQTRDRSRSTGSGPRPSFEENNRTSHSPSPTPHTRLGIFRPRGHGRDRSGSSGSLAKHKGSPGYRGGAVFDDDVVVSGAQYGDTEKSTSRPSILKNSKRSSLTDPSQITPPGYRSLRFDSDSSPDSPGKNREGDETDIHGTPSPLRASTSTGSPETQRGRPGASILSPASATSGAIDEDIRTESAAAVQGDSENTAIVDRNVEEEEYGDLLNSGAAYRVADSIGMKMEHPIISLTRGRGLSFASSQSSLSPIMSNENSAVDGATLITADFPFSINTPPPMYPEEGESVTQEQLLRVPSPEMHRSRGDSVSSTSTTDSHNNPQLSASGTTSGSGGSDTVITPWLTSPGRDSFLGLPIQTSPTANHENMIVIEDVGDAGADLKGKTADETTTITGLNERRPHIPPDINIKLISSHAQAEALVQKAQQDILDLANGTELIPTTGSAGRSPLSARLAAYGESLALERKLREQEAEKEWKATTEQLRPSTPGAERLKRDGAGTPRTLAETRRDGMERQHSLEHKSGRPRMKGRLKDPRRPSTAEGLAPRQFNTSFSSDQSGRSHQSSRSASGFGTSASGRIFISQEETDFSEEHDIFPVPQVSSFESHEPNTSIGNTQNAGRPRTPISDMDHGSQLSRISSLDGHDPDTDTELGSPLTRVSTAPLSGPSPSRGKRDVRSATKLTRMGFSPMEQTRAPSSASKRIGTFKSLFQSLKSKT